jgi:hypothetical protein
MIATAALALLVLFGEAARAGTSYESPRTARLGLLDQSSLPADFLVESYVTEEYQDAQTFTAGRSGFLDSVALSLKTFGTVVDSGNPASVPTGWVLFGVDGSPSEPVTEPLDAEGHASSSIDLRGVGTSTISATYCPDGGDFVGSAGTAKVSIVQNGTTTTVAASPAAVSVGQSTTLTATVAADDPDKTPTGSVQFSFDGQTLGGPVALVSGSATLVTSALPAGGRYIEAAYSPADGFFRPSSANGQVEVDRWPSTTAVDVQPAETVAGEPATFAAGVAGSSSDGHHPKGTVQFSEDFGAPIGAPVAIDATGTATLVAYGGAGDYGVRARYGGDDYFDNSEGSVDQTILRADTATAITSSPNPVAAGADLTIGVDVRVLEPGDVDPDGAVQLLAGGEPIDDPIYLEGYPGFDVTLTAPSTALTSTITAQYLGGPDTNPSSASLTQTVIASTSLAPPPPAPVPPPSPPVTPPTAAKSLATMVDGLRKTLRSRGIRALNGLSESFAAPAAGRVTQQIYSPTDPRAGSSSKLLATGATRLATARTAKLKLKLTAAGRRALRRARTVKLAVISRFTPATGPVTRRTDRISARGTRRSRRVVARRSTSGGAFAWPAPSPVLAGEQRPLIEQPWRIVSRAEPKR